MRIHKLTPFVRINPPFIVRWSMKLHSILICFGLKIAFLSAFSCIRPYLPIRVDTLRPVNRFNVIIIFSLSSLGTPQMSIHVNDLLVSVIRSCDAIIQNKIMRYNELIIHEKRCTTKLARTYGHTECQTMTYHWWY